MAFHVVADTGAGPANPPDTDVHSFKIPDRMGTSAIRAFQDYLRKPGVRTAKALVQHAIHEMPAHAHSHTTGTKRTRAQRGGLLTNPDLVASFAWSDMLHDVQDMPPHVWKDAREWILERCAPYITTKDVPSQTYNDRLARAWIRACGLEYNDVFETIHGDRTDLYESDTLADQLQKWALPGSISIVFDGIFRCKYEDIMETALLLLVMHGGRKSEQPRLKISKSVLAGLKEIRLVDGFFQDIDAAGADASAFLQNYAHALSKAASTRRKRVDVNVLCAAEAIPPKWLPEYSITPGGTIRLPDGSDVPYDPKNEWIPGPHQRKIHLPFRKSSLRILVQGAFATPATRTMANDLRRAALLNFFRDAYRADIAVQLGASLWTRDRLSFVFYTLLARAARNEHAIGGIYCNPAYAEVLVARTPVESITRSASPSANV